MGLAGISPSEWSRTPDFPRFSIKGKGKAGALDRTATKSRGNLKTVPLRVLAISGVPRGGCERRTEGRGRYIRGEPQVFGLFLLCDKLQGYLAPCEGGGGCMEKGAHHAV